ncbi:MAG: polynucleotide adenylyltransferase/metal dependent phosphohydrolase [Chloroflexota bacterium]|nr:polynucleotide adenylyltransferase/metal dependent phosphohydrolase [Chloroflexota bacterium]
MSTPLDFERAIPDVVHGLLRTLWTRGHAAYVVGGSLRDTLLGRPAKDWDLAAAALPERTLELFPGAVYENKFGTVAVRTEDPDVGEVEITTFRSDHDYADFRRPHRVEFSESIELDLARRDFTVNAMAWGAEPGEPPRLVDPHGGRADLAARILRTVGDPAERFHEDALRMVRAVRLAATLDFDVEPATLAAIREKADNVRRLSGERIAIEMRRLLAADRPSIGLRLMADTGLLFAISPDLAAQSGVPQNKVPGEDLWDHTLRAVDGATREPPRIRLAALLHDIGKPLTMADGRFLGHESVGAELADKLLDDWRWPIAERQRIVRLIRHHMFGYQPSWSDAAVRRFIVKITREELEDQFLLREADHIGSGREPNAGGLDELRARVAKELAAGVALDLSGLAVDGSDLMTELGITPGPGLGRLLDWLLERVIADPAVNTREGLLDLARRRLSSEKA